RARALVQPFRSASDVGCHDAPQGSRGQCLLPALLHGAAPGRWHAQAGGILFSEGDGDLPVVSLRRSSTGFGSRVAAQAGSAAPAYRAELGGLVSPERGELVRPA